MHFVPLTQALGAKLQIGEFVERNIRVCRVHRALSWLYLLTLAVFFVMAVIAPELIGQSAYLFLVAFFCSLFFAHHLTAKGARESKPWARASSMAISVFLFFGFPIGTVISIYLLANTWKPWDSAPNAGVISA